MVVLRFLKIPNLVRGLINILLSIIILCMPASTFTTQKDTSKYMLTGDKTFSQEAGKMWTVGYGENILTPEDVTADTYYIAGYNTNNPAKGVLDDMYAKAVYIDDNTDRGGVILCAIDCVGISRHDINDIRKLVVESGEIPSLKSINICSTHSHSAIDTQGLWGKNFLSDGKNENFMKSLKEKTADAIIKAYKAREDGKLFFGTAEAEEMQADTRTPIEYSNIITSIRFEPKKGNKDTYIVNFNAHAEGLGSKTTNVSADFPAYMTEEINSLTGGANVLFINGAVGGLITGDQIDNFLKSETFDCIGYTKDYGKKLANYVVGITNEKELSPIVNVKSEVISVRCDNTALLLARFLGVLNNDVEKTGRTEVSIISEVAYMELGNKQVGIFMIPGELYPELETGAFLSAEESATGKEADYKVLSEMTACEHSFVAGLCNDELGYIIPDNDFLLHEWLPYFNIPYDSFDRKHYEETNSVGPDTAGTILESMDELITSAK